MIGLRSWLGEAYHPGQLSATSTSEALGSGGASLPFDREFRKSQSIGLVQARQN